MPNYEYRCKKCGKTRVVNHGMDENPDVRCDQKLHPSQLDPPEECGGECVKIMSGGFGINVRGGTPKFH